MLNLKITCSMCGGANLRRNADTAWSTENQTWEVVALFDSVTCEDCDEEVSMIETEYPAATCKQCMRDNAEDCESDCAAKREEQLIEGYK